MMRPTLRDACCHHPPTPPTMMELILLVFLSHPPQAGTSFLPSFLQVAFLMYFGVFFFRFMISVRPQTALLCLQGCQTRHPGGINSCQVCLEEAESRRGRSQCCSPTRKSSLTFRLGRLFVLDFHRANHSVCSKQREAAA